MFEKSEETSPRRKSLAKQLNVLIPEKKDRTGEKVKRVSACGETCKNVRWSSQDDEILEKIFENIHLRLSLSPSSSGMQSRSKDICRDWITIRREERIKNMTYHGS